MNDSIITLEAVEALATSLENEDSATRGKLARLITAYARILSVREPSKFPAKHLEIADADGHWDNSFPPEIENKDLNGPRLLSVRAYTYDEIATSSGYYHAWRASTDDAGLYVDRKGNLWGAELSGEGRLGSYAAYPGNCGVAITVDWHLLDSDDLSTDDLRAAERHLRKLAFPLSTKADS